MRRRRHDRALHGLPSPMGWATMGLPHPWRRCRARHSARAVPGVVRCSYATWLDLIDLIKVAMTRRRSLISLSEFRLPNSHLSAHDREDINFLAVITVKNAARPLDKLPVPRAPQFLRLGATFGLADQLLDASKYALNELSRRRRLV